MAKNKKTNKKDEYFITRTNKDFAAKGLDAVFYLESEYTHTFAPAYKRGYVCSRFSKKRAKQIVDRLKAQAGTYDLKHYEYGMVLADC